MGKSTVDAVFELQHLEKIFGANEKELLLLLI